MNEESKVTHLRSQHRENQGAQYTRLRTLRSARDEKLSKQKLNRYHRKLERGVAEQMARNFTQIVRRHELTPRVLPYAETSEPYESYDRFRNDFYRMILDTEESGGRRIVATPSTWIRMMEIVEKHLAKTGVYRRVDYLVDELVSSWPKKPHLANS